MKEKIVLRSAHPEEYGDLEIEVRVLSNEEISAYLASIPDDKKFWATKKAKVSARVGIPGEVIKTELITNIDGKEYILSEESNTVLEREQSDGTKEADIVVRNINSTSNEEYIVKYAKFVATYTPDGDEYIPNPDVRMLTQVPENVMITTAWGARALCLRGSYIVTYDAATNDYNTLEQGAFNSTYEVVPAPQMRL